MKFGIMVRDTFLIYLLFFVCSFNAFCQDNLRSGLYFSSHEVIQDKRTSLDLTPYSFFKFSDNFSLEFEANFRQGDGYYGYIFRLLGDDGANIDLVSNFASTSSNFWLVYKEQTLLSFRWDQLSGTGYDQWVKIRFDVDIPTSAVSLSINDVRQETSLPEPFETELLNIFFGAIDHRHFASMDVCPMSVRDIRLFNNGELSRYWRLAEHSRDKVYDEIDRAEALVHNPVWIIDRHVKWEKVKEFQVDNLIGNTHDRKNGRIFFLNDVEMYCVDVESFAIDTIVYAENKPYEDINARQIIYNEYFNQLWSYDFDADAINVFDFDTRSWSENPTEPIESLYAHQNRFISPIDSSLVSFSGYGHYRYSSEVYHYDRQLKSWEKFDRKEQIDPRYLAGATVINDHTALLFGGFGSRSGQQELSPKFYYDLFYFDLTDFTFQEILTLSPPQTPFVPSEALAFDQESHGFYTLLYNPMQHSTHLRLGRFDIDSGDYIIYNDSIPFNFLDIASWVSLFLNDEKTELIAYVTSGSDVEIYSIAYPPKLQQDILQYAATENSFTFLYWLIPAVLLIALGALIYRSRRKRSLPAMDLRMDLHENEIDLPEAGMPKPVEQDKPSSIYLLGNFKIIDTAGNDLTADFAPTTTQLFLLILMATVLTPPWIG